MEGIFFDLTILLLVAAILGVLMYALRLPTILGYLLTGGIAASLGLIGPHNQETIRPLADIGVALVLFTVGLEMNVRYLKEMGQSVLTLGAAQISLTGLAGFAIGRLLGLDPLAALYLALALTMSSTIIVIRLLSQKQDLTSLYGRVTVGILLLQHIVVMSVIVLLSALEGESTSDALNLTLTIGKAILLVGNVIVLSQAVIPYLVHRISRSSELLFIVSLAWAFGIAALTSSQLIGFSIEIGGFLAGLALANSVEHLQIAGRIRPLRDFFILLFFVLLGTQINFGEVGSGLLTALLIALFVLIIKPLIVMILMGIQGFRKQTSFLTGLTHTQVSEFSLLLFALGLKLGHISSELVASLTLVAVMTMSISTALILHSEALYRRFRSYLTVFERKELTRRFDHLSGDLTNHVVLVGSHRTGHNILHALRRLKLPFVVVDFDPQVVDNLSDRRVNVIFGDISDEEVQERAQLSRARLVISTITDRDDTLRLLAALSKRGRPLLIVTAQDPTDAKEFYEKGADYVLLPHFVSGEHVADLLTGSSLPKRLATLKTEHKRLLLSPIRHKL